MCDQSAPVHDTPLPLTWSRQNQSDAIHPIYIIKLNIKYNMINQRIVHNKKRETNGVRWMRTSVSVPSGAKCARRRVSVKYFGRFLTIKRLDMLDCIFFLWTIRFQWEFSKRKVNIWNMTTIEDESLLQTENDSEKESINKSESESEKQNETQNESKRADWPRSLQSSQVQGLSLHIACEDDAQGNLIFWFCIWCIIYV